jgi:hypothetical protein
VRFAITAVLAGLAAAVLAVSTASGVSAPRNFSLLDVSRNTDQPVGDFNFNRPPRGGDQFAITDDLYRWAGTKRGAHYGVARGLGTFVTGFGDRFTQKATVLFVVQAHLPGGSLMIEGYGQINPNGPSKFVLPIVGGTGTYANARGSVTVRDLGNGESDKSNVDIRLEP